MGICIEPHARNGTAVRLSVAVLMAALWGPAAAGPIARIEVATPRLVRGWAFDPRTPYRPIDIELRFLSRGRVLETYRVRADERRPELARLLGDEGAHGFSLDWPAIRDAWPILVEVRPQDPTTGDFLTAAVARLLDGRDLRLVADITLLQVEHSADTGVLTVSAWLVPPPRRMGVDYAIEVWGQSGPWTTEVVRPPSGDACLRARIDLRTRTRIRDLFEASGTVLAGVRLSHRDPPARSRLAAALEVRPGLDRTQGWWP